MVVGDLASRVAVPSIETMAPLIDADDAPTLGEIRDELLPDLDAVHEAVKEHEGRRAVARFGHPQPMATDIEHSRGCIHRRFSPATLLDSGRAGRLSWLSVST